jgi:putative membrane protein insertion efficiency factor
MSAISRSLVFLMDGLIRLYQAVHLPFFHGTCRHMPTCSHYAREALQEWGPVRGGGMAALRILRCNPLFPAGYDPVPLRSEKEPRT